MKTFFIDLAGFIISISFLEDTELVSLPSNKKLTEEILRYIKNFRVEKPQKIDFSIEIESRPNPLLLLKKKEKKGYIIFFEQKGKKKIKTFCEISIFQFQFLLRMILDILLGKNNGFMLHASSVVIEGRGYIFLGDSNAGKSTAAKNLGSKYIQLSDDTVTIRKIGRQYFLFQTPFIERNFVYKKREKIPLDGAFFLEKSPDYRISVVKEKEYIIDAIFKQYLTNGWNIKPRMKVLMQFISKHHKVYRLYFGKDVTRLVRLFSSFSEGTYVYH